MQQSGCKSQVARVESGCKSQAARVRLSNDSLRGQGDSLVLHAIVYSQTVTDGNSALMSPEN